MSMCTIFRKDMWTILGQSQEYRTGAQRPSKLLGVAFTTAVGILIRGRERGLLAESEALEKLSSLAKLGRYKDSIIEDARRKLERHGDARKSPVRSREI